MASKVFMLVQIHKQNMKVNYINSNFLKKSSIYELQVFFY